MWLINKYAINVSINIQIRKLCTWIHIHAYVIAYLHYKKTFSKTKYIQYALAMCNKHLGLILNIKISRIQPQFNIKLFGKHPFHTSRWIKINNYKNLDRFSKFKLLFIQLIKKKN